MRRRQGAGMSGSPDATGDAKRLQTKHPKIASALTTLASAVDDTQRLLFHRGSWTGVLGVLAYLGFDVLVLWTAFLAVHAHPVPGFAIVITPPHMQLQVEMLSSATSWTMSTVSAPGVHGVDVAGIQGCGVSTPNAALVAAATCGFDGVMHAPNGMILTIGMKS